MSTSEKKVHHKWKPLNDCFEHDPLIKLLVAVLKRHGCGFDSEKSVMPKRSWPLIGTKLAGHYNTETSQIDIYKNNIPVEYVCRYLQHEMIHFFDQCRANFDYGNIDHVACSEIRAANLTECREFQPEKGATHQECVKRIATLSLDSVFSDKDQNRKSVDRIFERCYNDLEPFGRRIRYKSCDPALALWDNYYHGYIDSLQGNFKVPPNSSDNKDGAI